MVENSVQKTTQNQYKRHFTEWINFLASYQGDSDTTLQGNLQGVDEEEKIQILLGFMAFLYTEKNLEKATIANYLSGIKYHIQNLGGRTEFFHEIVITRFNRAAALNDAEIGRVREKKRPIPLTLIMYMITVMLNRRDIQDAPYRIAILMAYFFLLRQSEYIYQQSEKAHALLANDVEFRLTDGSFIHSQDVHSVNFDSVNLVKVTLRHCKNDPFRQGNSFWCERKDSSLNQPTIELVREMFVFASQAKSLGTDVFTSLRPTPNEIVRVSYRRVMELLRKVAVVHNLSPNVFGTHSFRISGATTLNSGHVETDIIQKMGGWRSKPTSLEYAQASTKSFKIAHDVLTDPTNFTLQDLELQLKTQESHSSNVQRVSCNNNRTSKVDGLRSYKKS
jgi:3-dehydroquinate dehydratase